MTILSESAAPADLFLDVRAMVPADLLADVNKKAPAARPQDSWPSWTDEFRWEPTEPEPEGPRPTPGPEYAPTADEDAEWSGFLAGLDDAGWFGGPEGWDRWRRTAFYCGLWAGRLARWEREDRERAEFEAWLDELARDRECEAFAEAGPRETDGFGPGYTS